MDTNIKNEDIAEWRGVYKLLIDEAMENMNSSLIKKEIFGDTIMRVDNAVLLLIINHWRPDGACGESEYLRKKLIETRVELADLKELMNNTKH